MASSEFDSAKIDHLRDLQGRKIAVSRHFLQAKRKLVLLRGKQTVDVAEAVVIKVIVVVIYRP